jgi:hypothetical protein
MNILLPTFEIKEGKIDEFNKIVEMNSDDAYSYATIKYACTWGNLMEKLMSEENTLEDIWEKASHDADTEGITGFMYGFATKILCEFWKHGEELRCLHNRNVQIGDEGEKANKNGGVLNPALLNIG